jgi:hypothetical protein
MHSAKSNGDGQQISLRVVGIICGLMGGGLCCFFVMAIVGLVYIGVELVLPGPHSAKVLLAFYTFLYGLWLLAICVFARKVELIFWALAMFPMPSMLFAVWLLEH